MQGMAKLGDRILEADERDTNYTFGLNTRDTWQSW